MPFTHFILPAMALCRIHNTIFGAKTRIKQALPQKALIKVIIKPPHCKEGKCTIWYKTTRLFFCQAQNLLNNAKYRLCGKLSGRVNA